MSEYDISCFYLLTKRALINGESEKRFHQKESLNDRRILAAINDEKAVRVLAKLLSDTYRNENGVIVKLGESDVRNRLEDLFRPEDL